MRKAGSGRALVTLAAAGLLLAGCRGAPGGSPPNVLLVTVDTLRHDAVDPTEGGRTPFLARFAAEGLRFERAYSTSSWTPPAVASILTGLDPLHHGLRRSLILPGEARLLVLAQEALPPDRPLLPELLREAGYRTFGITANGVLAPEFGFGRGFDRYRCLGFEDDGQAVLRQLREWLPEIRKSAPWFVWLHFLDPHAPYRPRPAHLPGLWTAAERYADLESAVPADVLRRLGVVPGSPRLAYVQALYRSEVAEVDRHLDAVFRELGPDADLAIVTSDHGEEFLEHGGFGHGATLFEEVIRVPLLVRLPEGLPRAEIVSEPVSLVDVLPTILEVAGVPPPADLDGMSLARRDPAGGDAPRTLFATLERSSRAWGAIRGRWKLVQTLSPQPATEGFDLEADPEEQRPVADLSASPLADLAGLVGRRIEQAEGAPSNPIIRLDREQERALRALGYVE